MGFTNAGRFNQRRQQRRSRITTVIQRKCPTIFPQNIPLLLGIVVLATLNLRNWMNIEFEFGVSLPYVDKGNPHPQVRFPPPASKWFPPPASKWLDDFDTNGTAPLCGANKCLYRCRANRYNADIDADQDPHGPQRKEYGYMVSQAKNKELERAQRVFLAWEKVQSLSEQFSVQHLFLGPPVPYNCSKPFANLLNKNSKRLVANSVKSSHRSAHYYRTDPKKLNATQLLVQPIELAPKDSIIFGCFSNKAAFARKTMIEYFADDSNRSSTPSPTDLDLLTFTETLDFGFRSTVKMLNSTEGNCMLRDFQVLIDPLSGRIYQLDIERCFENPSLASKFTLCRNHFRRFVTDLKRCKRGSCHPREGKKAGKREGKERNRTREGKEANIAIGGREGNKQLKLEI